MYGCVVLILVGHFLLVIRVPLSIQWLFEFQKPTMYATECTLAFCHEVLQSFQFSTVYSLYCSFILFVMVQHGPLNIAKKGLIIQLEFLLSKLCTHMIMKVTICNWWMGWFEKPTIMQVVSQTKVSTSCTSVNFKLDSIFYCFLQVIISAGDYWLCCHLCYAFDVW